MFDTTSGLRGRTILTGDRPTGALHLGHLAGSLSLRVALQESNAQTVLVADLQALTDNAGQPAKVRSAVREVMLDYLAVGLDPAKTTFALQSGLPALAELTMLYMNLVTVPRLLRNPTIRTETEARGFAGGVPAGFLCYPVSQAADITAFDADLVPAGADQAPLIEQTNEIVEAVNRQAGTRVLRRIDHLAGAAPRLPGIDGLGKMSKSGGNAILLSDPPEEIRRKVMRMFTDPGHLRVEDPGRTEGNVVFALLEAFDPDRGEVERLAEQYRAGGLGDMVLKRRLDGILQELLRPIRERRAALAADPGAIDAVLRTGTELARGRTETVLDRVRDVFGLATRRTRRFDAPVFTALP
ncbi:tryptophan--tRNA ligase [Cereibacter sphaeroides]|uniref:tryptophan--tRNA ligase n=1 Tax=Cereibacter sphaeroides TaxID=1063 RepID=UPI001EEF74E5|nr:tryptophan--tRNA ligase [Cereibacter sphaeroides]MCE6958283.1 tryptophan--tRNA ligase [Cereibacter sphaeroides]MCE6971893.1 tryptophan--tRNA ligase [Cereibacter sphaeroides]